MHIRRIWDLSVVGEEFEGYLGGVGVNPDLRLICDSE